MRRGRGSGSTRARLAEAAERSLETCNAGRAGAHPSHATRASCLLANNEICCIQVAMNYPRDFSEVCAISSVVERLLHTQEVAGSNPASRTTVSSAEKTLSDLKWRKIAAVVVIIITKMRLGKKVAGFITIM